jgi:hypothetical protein
MGTCVLQARSSQHKVGVHFACWIGKVVINRVHAVWIPLIIPVEPECRQSLSVSMPHYTDRGGHHGQGDDEADDRHVQVTGVRVGIVVIAGSCWRLTIY